MNLLKHTPDYISVIKYSCITFLFIIFNSLETTVMPYSIFLLLLLMVNGYSLLLTPILHIFSLLIFNATGLLAVSAVCSIFFVIISLINKKFHHTPSVELFAYALLGMLSFVIIGDTNNFISYEKRIFVSLVSVALTILGNFALNGLKKGLSYKHEYEELASLSVFLILFGLGTCNLFSPYLFKGVCAFMLLFISFVSTKGTCTLLSSILSLSLSLYYGHLDYLGIFLVWALVCECLTPISRFGCAVALIGIDYTLDMLFSVYNGYDLNQFLAVLIGGVAFFIIPKKPLNIIKDKLNSFKEKQLTRISINRNRMMVSNRLYELSSVFNEIASVFDFFKKNGISEENAKYSIDKQLKKQVCNQCTNCLKCKQNQEKLNQAIGKMIDIGLAKGKVSIIDMPIELADNCIFPSNLIFALNKHLAEYRTALLENQSINSGRDLISAEANGIADILQSLATSCGKLLKYQTKLERRVSERLLKNGFIISELLIYGDEGQISVGLIINMKEFALEKLTSAISKTIGFDMCLKEKTNISDNKCYLFYERASIYDAVFGISSLKKNGSLISGDTHSVLRISTDKFLVALSDGMGSGKNAQSVSSISLSLIESLYKAGMQSQLVLNTVNKLLSINTEDSFTALDVGVVNLNTATADFIKYGSPYGFIVGEKGIRIVEGCSLPLGILDELKPSVCNAQLCDGDVVLLLTDGISDAIGNSSAVIDFLRTQPAKNPQTLADNLLKKALEHTNGQAKDDMTVLAVRIFSKQKKSS